MVFVQVELKHTGQVQDLIGFLLARSYINFRVTDQDLFLAAPPPPLNVSLPPPYKTSPKPTIESIHGECPTLPETAPDFSMTPVTSSFQEDRKPIAVEIIDDDENDLSIENPEPDEKPGEIFSNEGGNITRKRKWTSANELALFGSMKQLHLNITILKRRNVLTNNTLCTVCEKQVPTTPRCFALHAGTKHMDLRSYRCAICQYGAPIKGNVIKHIKHHTKTDVSLDQFIDVGLDQFIESNLITIPFTKQQCDKIKELIETCFGVKCSERV
uniref:C2H2-type domain-containing protein n=1 Tax=Haemonchus contortus TaxID=6289 RepID=A0A7I4YQV8_HAECO|nr:unnamed protein product [Haemonchus contortus]